MAGIYSRIDRDTPSQERVAANLFHAAYVLRAAGKFNDAQILGALNSYITGRGGAALTAPEIDELTAIGDIMDAKPTAVAKLVYAEVLRAAMIAVEMRLMNEGTFNVTVELLA